MTYQPQNPQTNLEIIEYYQRLAYKYRNWLEDINQCHLANPNTFDIIIPTTNIGQGDNVPTHLMPNKSIQFYRYPTVPYQNNVFTCLSEAEVLLARELLELIEIKYYTKQINTSSYVPCYQCYFDERLGETVCGNTMPKLDVTGWIKWFEVDFPDELLPYLYNYQNQRDFPRIFNFSSNALHFSESLTVLPCSNTYENLRKRLRAVRIADSFQSAYLQITSDIPSCEVLPIESVPVWIELKDSKGNLIFYGYLGATKSGTSYYSVACLTGNFSHAPQDSPGDVLCYEITPSRRCSINEKYVNVLMDIDKIVDELKQEE